jgi:hypothetical protein
MLQEAPMRTLRFALGSILFVAFFATASIAQNARTFVSGTGSDSNPCSATSPCRTVGQAISVTNSGGEVIVLTSAGYGPFTINKSVTIEAPAGVYAGITVTSGDGIDTNAGAGTVILRGLTVNNQGSSGNGIVFNNSGGTLHIENCVVNGFSTSNGIAVVTPGTIFVKDTIVRGNGDGIVVSINTGGTAIVNIDHVHCNANSNGVVLKATEAAAVVTAAMDQIHCDANSTSGLVLDATVSGAVVTASIGNSSASDNVGDGMMAEGFPGAVTLDISGCLMTNNGNIGIDVLGVGGGSATASISNCTISRNGGSGFAVLDGKIYSRGNNTITGNGGSVGSLTSLAGQ